MNTAPEATTRSSPPLQLFSIIVPARDEEGSIASMVEHLHVELKRNRVPHEIVAVDDGSTDKTWAIVQSLTRTVPVLRPVKNSGPPGFGRAVVCGLDHARGDALAIMMADQSDDPQDAVKYWQTLNGGFECAFGSRFVAGSQVFDYPKLKLLINRLANLFIQGLFGIALNDTTNAFKAYRRIVIDGCRPILSPHFNITVELPLKAIVRGYTWTTLPISWRNRRTGASKLKLQEMGSRYLFICLYLWLEKYFSRGDYRRR
jgi:dolichol-phosphate mannosyltransferase